MSDDGDSAELAMTYRESLWKREEESQRLADADFAAIAKLTSSPSEDFTDGCEALLPIETVPLLIVLDREHQMRHLGRSAQ